MTNKSWKSIRKDFGVTKKYAYFQSAAMSPIPKVVYEAICNSYYRIHEAGDMDWPSDLETTGLLMEKIAKMLNTDASNLAFLPNTSTALSLMALSFRRQLRDDFNLVSTSDEFPATHIPFEYQSIPIHYAQPHNGRYSVDTILESVDNKTLGVVCSHVQYNTGFRQDIALLGKALKERGLLFILNATQGFPIFPIDVKNMHIDAMTASLHKWGCAGHVGALVYTSPEFRKRFPAPIAGWLSVCPPDDDFIITRKGEPIEIHNTALQYQFGTSNLQSLVGLKASFDYLESIGWGRIRQQVMELTTQCIASLSQFPQLEIITPHAHPEEQSAIISINLKNHKNEDCVAFLEQKGVIVTLRDTNIRLSCNFFNNKEDIERLTEGLREFLQD